MVIGAIPDAVLKCLHNHKDLGVHTEMCSDGIIELVEKDIINNKYILIQLFVDDKTSLPQPVKITENGQQRTLRTIGDKWSYFQRSRFGHNTQPFYVLLDPRQSFTEVEGSYMYAVLQEPSSYNEDIPAYIRFLRSGISTYQSR
jgi:thiol:disulfide interchange protein DsbD